MTKSRKTVLVFGTFDRLHDGHRFFLAQARALGDYLIVVVAQPIVVKGLKKYVPEQSLRVRISALRKAKLADKIIAGEKKINSWQAIKKYRPATVALGPDQKALSRALKTVAHNFPYLRQIKRLKAHPNKKLHSRFLRNRHFDI